ncbi:MAG: hypothetical protein JO273_00955 [Methylobacteriaceae bacterium]|nr:hypothetical protein [Methylobacteriaceae bacterium]
MKSLVYGIAATGLAAGLLLPAGARADDPDRDRDRDRDRASFSYVPRSLVESKIFGGPWTLHEAAPFAHDASGIVPTTSGPPYVGFGTPYAAYCDASHQLQTNRGTSLMQPYYFPFVRRRGLLLEGFFDYRPRNEEEATVSAFSVDWGATWRFTDKALALNPFCPADPTDPDNNNVIVNGVSMPYGSSSANAADNGLGHAFVLTVKGKQRIYNLDRANGHIDSDPLVVHDLPNSPLGSVFSLADFGYVSPLAAGGYPQLDPTAELTSGLRNPDAILGAVEIGEKTTIVYVEKTLNAIPKAQSCPSTPPFALTNLVNGKVRKTNQDEIAIRVATTTDGITFKDVGVAAGLQDPNTLALNGIRWLGSGSLIRISDGRVGMFFGAGNCLDNDSDGFHFLGYAETTKRVDEPKDLLSWKVIYGFDNPILSTDTVVDPAGPTSYPAHPPLVNVHGADALSAAQVAPFVPPRPAPPYVIPPGGYNSNFFSGRVYDPQAIYTNEETVTIVFAGYNTPQPSNNLGDYRTIGRFQLRVPEGYFSPF